MSDFNNILNMVSGCPRSGTSLTMNLLSCIFGDGRILQNKKKEEIEELIEERKAARSEELKSFLSDKRVAAFQYNREVRKLKNADAIAKRADHSTTMNPNGFYELSPYCVKGVTYNRASRSHLNEWSALPEIPFLKVVSQGLLDTDPSYINKLVYLLRDPRSVAKSHEKMVDGWDKMTEGMPSTEKKPRVHSPKMFINVTVEAARFFSENPDIDIHFVKYNDLLSAPEKTIKELCAFLDVDQEKGWTAAKDCVDPSLQRSKPDLTIESTLWTDAETIYAHLCKKEFSKIIEYIENPTRNIHQENSRWFCPRVGGSVEQNYCKQCVSNPSVRQEAKKTAAYKGVKWGLEPCLFECGFDTSRDEKDLKTIKESIDKNFWYEPKQPAPKITKKP